VSNETNFILPRLESIAIDTTISASDGMFADMVESRFHDNALPKEVQISRLQNVEVVFEEDQDDVQRLQILEEQGLDVGLDVMSEM